LGQAIEAAGGQQNGRHLAWNMPHIYELLEAAVLGGSLLPLLIAAGINLRQRRISNRKPW
jgi:hypothetical protein